MIALTAIHERRRVRDPGFRNIYRVALFLLMLFTLTSEALLSVKGPILYVVSHPSDPWLCRSGGDRR